MKRFALLAFLALAPAVLAEPAPRVSEVWEDIKKVGGALFAPEPIYPRYARARGIEGKGLFRLKLRKNGTVSEVAVLHSTGIEELDIAAARALIQWRFPAQSDIVGVRVPINFQMRSRLTGGSIHDH